MVMCMFVWLGIGLSCSQNILHKGELKRRLGQIALPPGFTISIYASEIPNARSMTLGEEGTLFVGTRTAGNVYAVRDTNRDMRADVVYTIAGELRMPNGVAMRQGDLYVAEVSRVLRYDSIESRLTDPPEPVVIRNDLPDDRHHGWKYIAFGPDELLYVPIGAPCNVCLQDDDRFASICRMKPDGSGFEIFAGGVRNTVGFDWHPRTGVLWFTDNGRDWMGDNLPPDELNRAPRNGMHFGFPFCHGTETLDPEYGAGGDCAKYVSPRQNLGPHVAALGMRFYDGARFPGRYRNQIFIAEHGSWNRSEKIGYRVMLVRLDGDSATSYEVFAKGWLQGESVWGRPVDVLIMPDGSMLISDDYAGAVYRIDYALEK
ncbi:MAG: sorbosone dehydrogenase family protein [Chitinivibrionales bacterium]|nr:sorbosone dehydrogenase family protein [Chitinivibrionales bacterium]